MTHTISVPTAPVFACPDTNSEHTDELLFGMTAEITDRLNGFVRIKDEFGYGGWTREENLLPQLAPPSHMICLPFADLLPDARNYYAPVMTLPMGAKVDAGFSDQFERYAFVVLPDKRTFYIHKKALAPLPKEPQSEARTRELIVENASKYLNVQYRWGGKTHAGIDCSGLAFMACHMAGINIWRDADFDKTPRLREIERDAAQPGDLYFFSGHIAVAIGDGDFIHATVAEGKVTYGTFEPKSAFYRKWYDENFIRAGSLF